jgi:hypothetical protein
MKILLSKVASKSFLIVTLVYFIINQSNLIAQSNDQPAIKFKDGVYLDFEQVLNNSPIPVSNLSISKNYYDIGSTIGAILDNKLDSIDKVGNRGKVNCYRIFGFALNERLIVCHRGLPLGGDILGRISLLSVYINKVFRGSVPTGGVSKNDPSYGSASWNFEHDYFNGPHHEKDLLDFNKGKIIKFTYRKLLAIFKEDPEIYNEYINLKRSDRQERTMEFVQKFNLKHPIRANDF